MVLALTLAGCGSARQVQAQGDLTATLETVPAPPVAGRTALLRITLERAGAPLEDAQVTLTRGMPGMQHPGDNDALPAQARGAGTYEAEMTFVMGGRWDVHVAVTDAHQQIVTFSVDVEQP